MNKNEKYEYKKRDYKGLLAIGKDAVEFYTGKKLTDCEGVEEARLIELGRAIMEKRLGIRIKKKKVFVEQQG